MILENVLSIIYGPFSIYLDLGKTDNKTKLLPWERNVFYFNSNRHCYLKLKILHAIFLHVTYKNHIIIKHPNQS